jgi:hypothetical protein
MYYIVFKQLHSLSDKHRCGEEASEMRAMVGLGPGDDQALATNLSGGMKRKLQMGERPLCLVNTHMHSCCPCATLQADVPPGWLHMHVPPLSLPCRHGPHRREPCGCG